MLKETQEIERNSFLKLAKYYYVFIVGNLLNIFKKTFSLIIFGINTKSVILTQTMYFWLLLQMFLRYITLFLCHVS